MPDFHLTQSAYTVADYCASLNRNEVVVNRDYQRSGKVWPPAAQSFLIETILLGYPIPKLSLHYVTDIKTRLSRREIIDGQQRTKAIKLFYDNKLRLSRTLDLETAAGRSYDELPADLQHAFLDYSITADIFTGASPDKIREVFRRINSYTVPLNPEEQRHATYQGEMKWFIYRLCRDFDVIVTNIGTFTQTRLVRMSDAKLYSEIVHALVHGIQTTGKRNLDQLYREFDNDFRHLKSFEKKFDEAMRFVGGLLDLHNGPLMRPHMLYSLILAIMHFIEPLETLEDVAPTTEAPTRDLNSRAISILSELAVSVDFDVEDAPQHLMPFVSASRAKTNVKQQRKTRFVWIYNALCGRYGC